MTRRQVSVSASLRHLGWLVAALFAISCIGDSSGPGITRPGLLQLVPLAGTSGPSGVVPIDRIRIVLVRPGQRDAALDTTVRVAPGDTAVDVSLTVAVFTRADTFSATVDMITPTGEVAFHGGPLDVVAVPAEGTRSGPPSAVPVIYVGTGADADKVVILSSPTQPVITGEVGVLTAVAKKADGTIIPGTPIGWVSLDPARARVPDVTKGQVVGGTQRGNARIVAQLVTGPADTVLVPVQLLPAAIGVVSGGGQSGPVRTLLTQPLVAQVKASDSVGVENVWVKFQVTAGGGTVSSDSVLTGPTGLASTQWTLGPAAGNQAVRATTPKLAGAQALFGASASGGAPAGIEIVAGDNQAAVAGTAVATAPSVVVKDADGNPIAGATVHFAIASGGGSVTGSTVISGATGLAQVGSWTLGTTAGSNTLTATLFPGGSAPQGISIEDPSPAAAIVTFTASGIPGSATALIPSGIPASVVSATPFAVTVTARDQHGNIATGYLGTIRFTSSDGTATLPANYAFTGADAGSHTFTGVVLRTGGTQSVTVTDVAAPAITGSGTSLVTAGGATQLAVAGGPFVAGAAGSVTVTARDGSGATSTGYTGTVQLTSNDPLSTLPGSYTFVPADNGVHVFSGVTLRFAGTRTVTATDVDQGSITGTANVTVNPTAVAYFLVTGLPATTPAGLAHTVTVTAVDTFSNTATGYRGMIKFLSSDTAATLPLDYAFTGTDAGVHTFTGGVTFETSGPQVLTVEDVDDESLAGGASITVNPTPATHLVFAIPPMNTLAGATITPAVTVLALDAYENLATGFTGTVSVSIGNNPAGGTLSGTLSIAATLGVAQFADLSIDSVGTGYTLTASAPASGLPAIASPSFDIVTAAGVVNWINVSGGAWSNPANWSGGLVPAVTDSVAITLAGTYTVTLDVNATVRGLTVGNSTGVQTLSAIGRTLTIDGTGTVNPSGVLSFLNSTIAGTGTIVNAGIITLNGGTVGIPFGNAGTVVVGGNVAVNNALLAGVGSTLRVGGIATATTLTVANGFVNHGTLELTATGAGYSNQLAVTNGILTNAADGTLAILTGSNGSRTLAAALNNQGTFNLNYPLTIAKAGAAHTNSAPLSISAASLTINQSGATPSFTNTGAITIGSGRTWTVTGGTLDLLAGTVTGPGTLNVSGATFDFSTSAVTAPMVLNSLTIPGGINVPGGETLTLLGGSINDQITNAGTILLSGTVAFNGALTTVAGSTLGVGAVAGPTALTIANGFTNHGTLNLTATAAGYSNQLAVTAGTLVNAPDGTLAILAGSNGSRTLAAAIDNQGTFTLGYPLSISKAGAVHTNSASMSISAANLTVTQSGGGSFTNTATGTITIGAGRTFAVTGGTLDLSAGALDQVTGPGTLSVSGATFLFSATTVTAPLIVSSVSLPTGLTVGAAETLRLLGGSIDDPITNAGAILLSGTLAFNGPFTTVAGSTLGVGSIAGSTALTVANGFVNHGVLNFTATAAGYSNQLAVTTGTLTNAPDGTLAILAGANGSRTLAAALDNQGVFTLDYPLTISKAGANHSNSSAIAISAANLTINQGGGSFTNTGTGTVTIGAGRTWTVSGGTLDLSNGLVDGTGTLNVSGATFLFSTTTVTTPLIPNSVTIPGGLTVPAGQTLVLLGGSIDDAITNAGSILLSGTVAFNGALTTVPGSTLGVGAIAGSTALTIANGFTNHGTLNFTATAAGYSNTLAVTTGTLTNAADGTLAILAGANGSRTLAAALDNQGAFTLGYPLTINKAGAVHTNSAAVSISAANLSITQSGGGSFTNTGTGTITIGAGRTWTVSGGTLDLSNGLVNGSGTLNVSGATFLFSTATVITPIIPSSVTIPGGLTVPNGQTLTLLGGSIDDAITNAGTILLSGSIAFNGALTTVPGSTLGVGSVAGSTALTVANGFTNHGTLNFTATAAGYSNLLAVTTGTLTNAADGTFAILAGANGSRTLAAALDNQGTFTLNYPLTINKPGAVHTNSAAMNLAAANLTITQSAGSFTNSGSGTIAIGAGRTWTVTGGTLDLSTGAPGIVSGPGTLNVSGATFLFSPTIVTAPLIMSSVSLPSGLTVSGSETLTLLGGSIDDPINNAGSILLSGTVAFNGSLTTLPGSILGVGAIAGSTSLTVANGFTNHGTLNFTATAAGYSNLLAVTNGTLVNASDGTFAVLAGANGSRTLAAALDNQGTLTLGYPLTINKANAVHTNSAPFSISSANLAVTQTGGSFTNSSTITIGAGRTWTVTGGTLDLSAGSVTGSGTLNVSGATFSFSPTTVTTPIIPSGVSIPGGLVVGAGETLTLLGGSIDDAITNAGTILLSGTVAFNGTLTTVAGSTLGVGAVAGSTALTVANSFTNHGTLNFTATAAGYSNQLAVTAGTLTNASDGTFAILAGSNGSRTLAAELNNLGTMTVGYSLTISRNAAAHINSGTIDVTGGNVTVSQSGSSPSFTNTGVITIAAGRTFTVTGGGTFVNANTPTPGTIRGSGTLNVSGATFTNAGVIDPGTAGVAGTLSITGAVTFQASSVVISDWIGPGSYDILAISGASTDAGEFRVNFVNTATAGTMTPLTYGSHGGSFNVTSSGATAGHTLTPVPGATSLVITIT